MKPVILTELGQNLIFVIISDHFTLSCISRLRGFGSDHFALFAELLFEAGRNVQQSGLEANENDLARAKAKADDVGVSKNDVPHPGIR